MRAIGFQWGGEMLVESPERSAEKGNAVTFLEGRRRKEGGLVIGALLGKGVGKGKGDYPLGSGPDLAPLGGKEGRKEGGSHGGKYPQFQDRGGDY